ncbi:malate synthase G [Colwellia psychrerythraea]|uniref:Malate synthase G n=1 Tax=Colwellia psychrerythraea TaxID=28229 RepID=A0A099KJ92_COLPS|nr:malate synthase G [Colwellia psychrerythraea]KGJ90909.1 Malate synthase G [Colwellia psychrerythraea]
MKQKTIKHGYKVAGCLYNLVNHEVLPGLTINAEHFWDSVAEVLAEFTPRNQQLLATRASLQAQIDVWHTDSANQPFNQQRYELFLKEIGYLVEEKADFTISTNNVDDEVARIAGPQLVVPLKNARFSLNAANARWGSLYDALYGTDVIGDDNGAKQTKEFNPIRGRRVQAYARRFLDDTLPLTSGSHIDAVKYHIVKKEFTVTLFSGEQVQLKQPEKFVGYNGTINCPSSLLCRHNGLHIEIQIDKDNVVGKTDAAAVKDVVLESALSTIQDCEDSIAAVDAADKTSVYRNWLGLMKGDLAEIIQKGNKTITRTLNHDRSYLSPNKEEITLSGRSLQFVRNVGHLMTTDAIITENGDKVPEGIVDGLITSLISLHDIKGNSKFKNSKKGSIYIVKPKMHGPEEVKFSHDLFSAIERHLGLAENTIKMGIMDEERRTSANLKECIRAAQTRVAFINTGFLDRTGDEIHTSMLAGAMAQKDLMKNEPWITAYELRNVRIGLQAGLQGKAQIGKGMWAIPDQMSAMVNTKIAHPKSGANCAWVPSPTAATLHVMHYHKVNVQAVQTAMQAEFSLPGTIDDLTDLLTIPLLKNQTDLSATAIQKELDNNIQGLLGYVVRWVNQGIGCSKVPDIDNIARMEDRATLRISSQHVCNWLHHGVITEEQVNDSLKRMAPIVDQQNINDDGYIALGTDIDQSIAFKTAAELIFQGKEQPSGYTEPLLHKRRIQVKAAL